MNDGETNPTTKPITFTYGGKQVPPQLRRTRAAALIDEVRVLAAEALASGRDVSAQKLANILELDFGLPALEACQGEAHLTGPGRANGHIDHCSCAPRWGWLGAKAEVR